MAVDDQIKDEMRWEEDVRLKPDTKESVMGEGQ